MGLTFLFRTAGHFSFSTLRQPLGRKGHKHPLQARWMDSKLAVKELAERWCNYLQPRGHLVKKSPSRGIVTSRNGPGRYRWVLFAVADNVRILSPADRKRIHRELDHGRKARQVVYIVAHFGPPFGKLVVLPAESALAAGRLASDKGGIPWED
jgi:hypothetical protein